MAIKRGVSLYSYQQSQFFKKMDWKDQVREVREGLGADGVEIIDEATIRDYPFPSDQFVYEWHNYLARYRCKAITMDVYLDTMQWRDHVMNHEEAAERLKFDIMIAAKLGFRNVRCLCAVPIDVIEMALPTAEKYDVRIGKEIHAPFPIKRYPEGVTREGMGGFPINDRMCEEIMALADKYHTKYVGLVPDFGIFQHSASQPRIDWQKRHCKYPEAIDFIVQNKLNYSVPEMIRLLQEKYPDEEWHARGWTGIQVEGLMQHESSAQPEDLREIVPYIVSMHGKFYQMTEIPGEPGHYEDKAIDYANPIRVLNQEGFEGYIDSEYEGQRDQQDRGIEFLSDEVEEVRRHHEMLQRLFDTMK
ncbi:xylose isomerase [Lachnoclostridium sp. Marseille-P6806]|uniref:xylose isomerase n=1 Tax=Lachnoclostridium sp. Marseille-P6806 TaxID=2364793 RepID=UPI0010322FCF|nr:xylose isomerase [Lachnoclostridium sp. Marseille-P6806]